MQSQPRSDEIKILLPVSYKDNSPFIRISDISTRLHKFCDTDKTTIFVQPQNHCGEICYVRLATHVFTALANIGKPRLNIVIRPLQPDVPNTQVPPRLPTDESDWLCVGYPVDTPLHALFDKYDTVAVGGTFDRMHAGHRLLLSTAAWAARRTLRIGITADSLLKTKKHSSIIASMEQRAEVASSYARLVKPTLSDIVISVLTDTAGPSATEAEIEALVVSKETVGVADGINNTRVASGLDRFDVIVVDNLQREREKLSSTVLREEEIAHSH